MTLSINNSITFLEDSKQGFKRTIYWNNIDLETSQTKTSNLGYNKFLLFFIKTVNNDPKRNFSFGYYKPAIEMKDINVLIYSKPFFVQPVKNDQEPYEKLVEMSINNDYTTGNLLNYLYHQKYYKIIDIDLQIKAN